MSENLFEVALDSIRRCVGRLGSSAPLYLESNREKGDPPSAPCRPSLLGRLVPPVAICNTSFRQTYMRPSPGISGVDRSNYYQLG